MDLEEAIAKEKALRQKLLTDLHRWGQLHEYIQREARKEHSERLTQNDAAKEGEPLKPLLTRFIHQHRQLMRQVSGVVGMLSNIRIPRRGD